MTAMITSRSRLRIDSTTQPNLRLVTSDPGNRRATVRTSEQSPKTSVMACLTADCPGNGELLRKAADAAREHDGQFYAVFVDSPRTRFGKPDVQSLIDDTILATYLGARIVRLESFDVVGELLQFAQQSRVGRIFVSRDRPAPFPRLFGRTVYSELLKRGDGFRIDVSGFRPGN